MALRLHACCTRRVLPAGMTISPVPTDQTVMARGATVVGNIDLAVFLRLFNISHAQSHVSRPLGAKVLDVHSALSPTRTHTLVVQRVQFLSTRDGHSTQLDQPSRDEWTPRAPVRGDKIPGIGHSVANATVLQLPGLLLAPRVSSSFFHDGNLCVPVNVLARTTKRHVHRGGANPKEGPGHGICDYWLWNPSYSIETTGSLAQLGARIRLGARRPRTTYPMSQRKK